MACPAPAWRCSPGTPSPVATLLCSSALRRASRVDSGDAAAISPRHSTVMAPGWPGPDDPGRRPTIPGGRVRDDRP
jgi:hypothetical protein